MRVARWYGGDDIRIEQVPKPALSGLEVRIRVAVCAVCGTDVHSLAGKFPLTAPPCVLGHEFSGTVAEIGPQVTRVQVGDRVAVEPGVVCHSCWYCRNGQEHLCTSRQMSPGGFAEYAVVPESVVWRLPDALSLETAALAEPMACAVHAVDQAQLRSGSTVAILGAGAIGLSLLQLCRLSGAATTVVLEPDAGRRDLALRLGADLAVDPLETNAVEAIRSVTDGRGADAVFEAVGLSGTYEQSIQLAAKGGRIVLMGVTGPEDEIKIRPYDILMRELTLAGSFMRPYTFGRALNWLVRLDVTPVLGPEFTLERTLDAIYAAKSKTALRPLVRP